MKDELPGGYGFAPKRRPKRAAEGPLYLHPVGALRRADPVLRATVLGSAIEDVQMEVNLFAASGDVTHIWRAWRTARVFGDVPPELLALIAPYLDLLASCESSSIRVRGREANFYLLADYDSEVAAKENNRPGSGRSLVECRQRVAARWNTTEGAVKQLVLKREKARAGR